MKKNIESIIGEFCHVKSYGKTDFVCTGYADNELLVAPVNTDNLERIQVPLRDCKFFTYRMTRKFYNPFN